MQRAVCDALASLEAERVVTPTAASLASALEQLLVALDGAADVGKAADRVRLQSLNARLLDGAPACVAELVERSPVWVRRARYARWRTTMARGLCMACSSVRLTRASSPPHDASVNSPSA